MWEIPKSFFQKARVEANANGEMTTEAEDRTNRKTEQERSR